MAVRSVLRICNIFALPKVNYLAVSQRSYNKAVRIRSFELKKRQEEYFEKLKPEEKLNLERRDKFIEWNYSAEIFAFGKRLQEDFKPEHLVNAFTHRSYIIQEELKLSELGVKDASINLKDNDKLAENGEKIISNYVPRYVSHFYPRFPLEGITSVTDFLMSDEVLANVSKNLGTTFLILSADYPRENSTYAKTLKAIIGALNESQNLRRANLLVRDLIVTQLAGKDINEYIKIDNPLEVLNTILKKDGKKDCEPRIICQSAMNTILANYHIGLYSDKQLVGHCSGETVEIAIEMAACDALKRLFHTTDSCTPISYNLENVPDRISNLSLSDWCSSAFENKVQIPIKNQKKV